MVRIKSKNRGNTSKESFLHIVNQTNDLRIFPELATSVVRLVKLYTSVVPAFSGWVNDVEDRLRSEKSHRCRGSSNCTANKIWRAVRDSDDIDQKVLVGKVGGVRSDKESGGTADDATEGGVILGVFVRWFLDVFQVATKDGSSGTESSVKGQSTADPGAREDTAKAEVGSLKGVDKRLPRRSTAEGSGTQQNCCLKFGLHIYGFIAGDGLLGTIVYAMTSEDTKTVPNTRGQRKIHRIGCETEIIFGNNGGCLPSKAGRKNLGYHYLGSYNKTIHDGTGRVGDGVHFGCGCDIGFFYCRAVDFSSDIFLVEGRRRCKRRHETSNTMVADGLDTVDAESVGMKEYT